MSATHTLDTVSLPAGMVWTDEYDWSAAERKTEYSTTGALLVDVGTRQAGRPITLAAAEDAGWLGMTRAKVEQLRTMAADTTKASHALTLADGRAYTVMFAPDDPVQAHPIGRPELPSATQPYVVTLHLLEVAA